MAVAGCGGKASATAHPTPQKHVAPTPTSTPLAAIPTAAPAPTPEPTATALPAPTATARPTVTRVAAKPQPTSTPAVAAPQLLGASLRPSTVSPGASLSATVSTAGAVRSVQMYIGSGDPTAPAPAAYTLFQSGPDTWTATIPAPRSPGQYHYTVGLFPTVGRRALIDNDGWNVLVTGGSQTGGQAGQQTGPQPIPGNIPLVPPFNYGNPVAATFTALGKSIAGSEVVSNARPDVSAAAVGQFYTTRLPRAGWTVISTSGAAAGASSFSIAATTGSGSGSQVVIVQYAAGIVHIFYGTLPS